MAERKEPRPPRTLPLRGRRRLVGAGCAMGKKHKKHKAEKAEWRSASATAYSGKNWGGGGGDDRGGRRRREGERSSCQRGRRGGRRPEGGGRRPGPGEGGFGGAWGWAVVVVLGFETERSWWFLRLSARDAGLCPWSGGAWVSPSSDKDLGSVFRERRGVSSSLLQFLAPHLRVCGKA